MERKEVLALATTLGLEFKKNISTKKLLDMIAIAMNSGFTEGAVISLKDKVFCGKSPITGKEVWK